MSLYDSDTFLKDLDLTIEKNADVFDALRGQSVLITGATGAVCSPIVDLLLRSGRSITVYVAGRNKEKSDLRFSAWSEDPHYRFIQYDATRKNIFSFHVDYIIHGASNSSPTDISQNGIETMLDNFLGIYELLIYAKNQQTKNTLYISSSEIYGKKTSMDPLTEDEYGWIDILSPRSSYPSSKRAAETLCACFSKEKDIKTTVVRPGHIYGPTAKRGDTHVANVFAYDAADGKNLVMKSTGKQFRSWCYSVDSASAILTVLVKGKNANAYNISNPSSIASIKDMAGLIASEAGVEVIMDVQEMGNALRNPMDNSSLNAEKLQALGWNGLFDAKTGVEHTVRIIREGKL